ncbi:MAG: 4'-phosphopantetheinyl transferase family protein [Microcoleaceae cyanobacterium]
MGLKYSRHESMDFQSPPEQLQLLAHQVHIWRADLQVSAETIQQLQSTLSTDESQRAARFRFNKDRFAFIAARGILRKILSQYLGCSSRSIQFSYSSKGKPTIEPEFLNTLGQNPQVSHPQLYPQFNLSHSQGIAIYGVTLNRQIGIDLEWMRPIESLALAERFFSPTEYQQLKSTPINEQTALFYQLWVCREAYLKATGEGIAALQKIEVNLPNSEQFQIIRDQQSLNHWTLQQLHVTPGYKAAIAIEGKPLELLCWNYLSH